MRRKVTTTALHPRRWWIRAATAHLPCPAKGTLAPPSLSWLSSALRVELFSCLNAVFCLSNVQNKTIEPQILEHIYAPENKNVNPRNKSAHTGHVYICRGCWHCADSGAPWRHTSDTRVCTGTGSRGIGPARPCAQISISTLLPGVLLPQQRWVGPHGHGHPRCRWG